jgi:dolichol-phosphate mannosyltransferase
MPKQNACIVLPTINEAENVAIIIPLIFKQQSSIHSHHLIVIVVDDQSPDGTGEVVKSLQHHYPDLYLLEDKDNGLGEAYIKGMKYAIDKCDADVIIQMDADLQHDPSMLPLFLSVYNYGFTLVIGSRFAPGGQTPEFTLYRKFLSSFGNFLVRLFSGIPRIHDCTSGYRCIKSELIKKCDFSNMSVRGYSFQSSLVYELLRNGAKILEIPIIFEARKYGTSKLAFRDQLEFLINLFRIRFHKSKEFFKFGVVGTTGVLVNMGLLLILTRLFGIVVEYASPIAIEISIISNFVLNNLWTFRARTVDTSLIKRLFRFHLVALSAGVINYITLLSLHYGFGMMDVVANLIGIAAATIVNYILNSRWTWKRVVKFIDLTPEHE